MIPASHNIPINGILLKIAPNAPAPNFEKTPKRPPILLIPPPNPLNILAPIPVPLDASVINEVALVINPEDASITGETLLDRLVAALSMLVGSIFFAMLAVPLASVDAVFDILGPYFSMDFSPASTIPSLPFFVKRLLATVTPPSPIAPPMPICFQYSCPFSVSIPDFSLIASIVLLALSVPNIQSPKAPRGFPKSPKAPITLDTANCKPKNMLPIPNNLLANPPRAVLTVAKSPPVPINPKRPNPEPPLDVFILSNFSEFCFSTSNKDSLSFCSSSLFNFNSFDIAFTDGSSKETGFCSCDNISTILSLPFIKESILFEMDSRNLFVFVFSSTTFEVLLGTTSIIFVAFIFCLSFSENSLNTVFSKLEDTCSKSSFVFSFLLEGVLTVFS